MSAKKKRIGRILKELRKARNLSSADLTRRAKLYGKISRSYVLRLEADERAPSRDKLLILAKALDLSPEETDKLLISANYPVMGSEEDVAPNIEDPAVIALIKLLGDARIPSRKRNWARQSLLSQIKWLHAELSGSKA